jgi:hypothetical protein
MQIGILTQPLHNNYGGLLQTFALQKVLKGMGHEPTTIDLQAKKRSWLRRLKSLAGRLIRKYLLKQQIPSLPNAKEKAVIAQHTARFIRENIHTTKTIQSVRKMNWLQEYNFDAYVVGSDQVWRPRYSADMPTFFLDFLKDKNKVKRIAYAASFGVDHWEYSPGLTRRCKNLAQKFDAVSVREDSGVALCNEYLNVSATHLLDPTLLLEKEDYITLIEKDQISQKPNTLMLYVLDQTLEKMAIAEKIKDQLGLVINSVMPEKKYSKASRKKIDDCVFPPVTQWLRGLMDAEFVVTDSFHGTVFSILFNKPFIVIGNESRGLTRFESLLNLLGLKERLILSKNDLDHALLHKSIDYKIVNEIIKENKLVALQFLKNSLNSQG